MVRLNRVKSFEWDRWNIDKSYKKHGITPNEAEEPFLDENLIFLEDIKHSHAEERFMLIGETTTKKLLFVVFTYRDHKVRIVSARLANRKERKRYETQV